MNVRQAMRSTLSDPEAQMFEVRVAGNVDALEALGSLEYAASHLDVRNIYVIGHTCCGAVAAAAAYHRDPSELTLNLAALVNRILFPIGLSDAALKANHANPSQAATLLPIVGEFVNAASMAHAVAEALSKIKNIQPQVFYGVCDISSQDVQHISTRSTLAYGFGEAPADFAALGKLADRVARWGIKSC